jgi:hypothetical protein
VSVVVDFRERRFAIRRLRKFCISRGAEEKEHIVMSDLPADTLRVWVSSWEQECCGDPFRVGGEARWTLAERAESWPSEVVGDAVASTITHMQNHHDLEGNDAPNTLGVVTAIQVVFCRYVPAGDPPGLIVPVLGSAVLRRSEAVAIAEEPPDGLQLVGYIVDLSGEIATELSEL